MKTLTTRWSSATELLIFAINSFRAPKLAASSIRAGDGKIWLEPVRIREVGNGADRLSLIVGDEDDETAGYGVRVGRSPRVGKKYQ